MKNLMTRKLLFGMLMVLVLAFSVQGIADALTFRDHTSSDGDLRTLLPNDPFTIKFSVNPTTSKDIFDSSTPKRQTSEDRTTLIDRSGYTVRAVTVNGTIKYFRISGSQVVDNSEYVIHEGGDKTVTAGTTEYQIETGDRDRDDTDGDLIKAAPDEPLSDSLQHHYNDEAIRIYVTTTTGARLGSLERSGTPISYFSASAARPSALPLPDDTDSVSLIEETKNRQLDSDLTLSSSITLNGKVTAAGVYTITIEDMTHTADFPDNDVPSERATHTFTLYVVPGTSSCSSYTHRFPLHRRRWRGWRCNRERLWSLAD